MTTMLVAPLTESRPEAHRWLAAPLALGGPSQPTLDLRPAAEPLVLAEPMDLADRTAPGLPDAQAWSVALATRLFEVLAARRPVSQLSRWLSEEVLTALTEQLTRLRQATGDRATGRRPAVKLQSVRLQYPRTGAVEVSIHARLATRSVACAFRLEAQPSRWLCTALDLGPGGRPTEPDPT
ncbi:Rv3235 family protein [uncultured Friedmanniella sp.]|uniref:Rv3235 family protein n=1 Tax=uncultured Friedmanniella sp. TaxID=335381 RepID=UPI0035CAB102